MEKEIKEKLEKNIEYGNTRNILKLVGFGALTIAGFLFVGRKGEAAGVKRYARETEA